MRALGRQGKGQYIHGVLGFVLQKKMKKTGGEQGDLVSGAGLVFSGRGLECVRHAEFLHSYSLGWVRWWARFVAGSFSFTCMDVPLITPPPTLSHWIALVGFPLHVPPYVLTALAGVGFITSLGLVSTVGTMVNHLLWFDSTADHNVNEIPPNHKKKDNSVGFDLGYIRLRIIWRLDWVDGAKCRQKICGTENENGN